MTENIVHVSSVNNYDVNLIYDNLYDEIFSCIRPQDTILVKPNWVKESHLKKLDEWEYVITHPTVITAVLKKILEYLDNKANIIITDGPQTDSSFKKIIMKYPIKLWERMCQEKGISLQIIDLREDEWINENDITTFRKKLPGDPRGNVEINFKNDNSEFFQHQKSKRGYYGADYNLIETNQAHDGKNNRYKVSKTVIEADVFINLPKMKTHKKAGITCCLKNLVGINTYKNYLPHYLEGSTSEGGDQYPKDNINSKLAGPLMAYLKQNFLGNIFLAKIFIPIKKLGKIIFGDTSKVIRSGNWFGNDTLWRMVLDLNKILYYANSDGSLKKSKFVNRKKYIGIVDGILAGEGNGPMAPEPVNSGFLIMGTNPASIDAVCAKLMGFDWQKIPSIKNAFNIKHYPLCDFSYNDIIIKSNDKRFNKHIKDIDYKDIQHFKPHFGWKDHIEIDT